MKGKRNNVCSTCRRHKIGCDGAMPSCTQCCRTGRQCGGYKHDAVFVHYPPKSNSSKKLVPLIKASDINAASRKILDDNNSRHALILSLSSQIPRPIDTSSFNEFSALISSRFLPMTKTPPYRFETGSSQVCGAWVDLLPNIDDQARSGELIATAVRAFGLALLDRGPEGRYKDFNSANVYASTLGMLSSALKSPESCFKLETAAAILCLAMVELMLPDSKSSTLAHFGGLGTLISMYPPGIFDSGDYHAIFVGCRPVLMLQAMTARKTTFLGRDKWLSTPFRKHSSSELQSLFGDVAILPGILEGIDKLGTLTPEIAQRSAFKFKLTLSETLVRLKKWDGRFELIIKPGHMPALGGLQSYWFPSLLAANVYTHMWTFQIICFTELAKLTKFFPNYFCEGHDGPQTREAWEQHRMTLNGLATKICQSMEYLLQEEMLLYGPAASMWPLAVAFNVFIENPEVNREHVKRCREYFDIIRSRGFLSVPVGTEDARSKV